MVASVTFNQTVKDGSDVYTVADSPYILSDRKASKFIKRGWATGTVLGNVPVRMLEPYKEGTTTYNFNGEYQITNPLGYMLVEDGFAVETSNGDVDADSVELPFVAQAVGLDNGLATLMTTFTYRNTSASAQIWQPVRIAIAFPKGDVSSTEKIVIYNADDTISAAQIDQTSTWSDGSIKMCVARAWVPSVAGSGTYQFKIKKATGSRAQTPVHNVSDISSGWNIKCQFQNFKDRNGEVIGSGTFSAALNDNIANSAYARVYASGPQCLGVRSWSRMTDETGAAERYATPCWFYVEIWRRPSDSVDVLCVMANPRNPWFLTATKTAGGNHYAQPRLLDGAAELLNRNTTLLTFTDADVVDPGGGKALYINKPGHQLQDNQIVRVSSSGSLPGSLEAGQFYLVRIGAGGAADKNNDEDRFRLIWSGGAGRTPLHAQADAATDRVNNPTYGHSMRTGQPMRVASSSSVGVADGVYFSRVIDANGGTLHPTPADALANTNIIDLTANGDVKTDSQNTAYSAMSPAGSGTHTLTAAAALHFRTGLFLADADGDEVWVGMTKPTMVPELTDAEIAYQISSGTMPPVDRTLTATVELVPYWPSSVGPWRAEIAGTGAHDMIGYWPGWAERTLVSKSADGWKTVKAGGLVSAHVYNFFYLDDALNGGVEYAVPVTMNNGPAKNGVPYSGMGPIRKDYSDYSTSFGANPARDYGPKGLWFEQTGQDWSHWPRPALAAYRMTGCYWFADLHANAPLRHLLYNSSSAIKEDTIEGTKYYNRLFLGPFQTRAVGWGHLDLGCAALLPDDMPEREPLLDAARDNLFRLNYYHTNYFTQAHKDWGHYHGVDDDGPPPTIGDPGIDRQWMQKYRSAGFLTALHLLDLVDTYPNLRPWCLVQGKKLCDPATYGLVYPNAHAFNEYNGFYGPGALHEGTNHWTETDGEQLTFNADHTCDRDIDDPPVLTNGDLLIVIGKAYSEQQAGNNPPAGVAQLTVYYVGDVGVGGATKLKLYTDVARTTQLTWGGGTATNVHCAYQTQSAAAHGSQDYARISVGLLVLGKLLGETGLDPSIAGAKTALAAWGSTGASDLKWEWNL